MNLFPNIAHLPVFKSLSLILHWLFDWLSHSRNNDTINYRRSLLIKFVFFRKASTFDYYHVDCTITAAMCFQHKRSNQLLCVSYQQKQKQAFYMFSIPRKPCIFNESTSKSHFRDFLNLLA